MNQAGLSQVVTFRESAAKAISYGLNPLIVGPVMFLYLSQYQPVMQVRFSIYVLSVLLFFSIIPLGILLVFRHLKKIETIDVKNRVNRHWPFIFGLLSYSSAAILLGNWFQWTGIGTAALLTLLSSSSLAAFITLKWKISVHNAAASMAACYLVAPNLIFLTGTNVTLTISFALLLVSGMIWSRVAIKAHTFSESIAGSLLGIVSSLFFIWLIPI